MVSEINGVVYFAGKEKAIVDGFFGKTINPEIVFLFINKSGQKYFVNQENIIASVNAKDKINPGEFYEFKKSEKGRKFVISKSNNSFDLKLIEDIIKDENIKENIELDLNIVNRELKEQLKIRKKKNIILDIIYLFIILSLFSLTQKVIYAIPFIVVALVLIIILNIYIRKCVKYVEKI